MLLLENDLYELEATVERLRGQAANKFVSYVPLYIYIYIFPSLRFIT